VWSDYRNGNGDIFKYDLSTKTEIQITTNPVQQSSPDVYGNIIVWQDDRNGNWDIYMYDLSTSTEMQITNDPVIQAFPAVCGNIIVWEDYRNVWADIYMYDLSTSTETQITTNNADQCGPAVYGNTIVWADDRNGNWDIFIYDLSTSTETQVTADPAIQWWPAVYGNIIVWHDNRNGNWDIYMAELSFPSVIEAMIDVNPDRLNLRSKGKWITAYIQLPEDYNAADINASTILLNGTIAPVLDFELDLVTDSSKYLVDHNGDGVLERMVKFDRASIACLIYQSVGMHHEVTLTITGELTGGTRFEGTYEIFSF
jgi:beta propeller repeat protein